MESNQYYDALLNEAKSMFASGYDNTYIEFQFAEKGIDDTTIDKIVEDVNKLRKQIRRGRGMKWIISGGSLIAAALIIISICSYLPFSKIYIMYLAYFMVFLAVNGVVILIKGIVDILGV